MNRLRELRKIKKMSQLELAGQLNAAQNTISNWELGIRDIDSNTAKKLATFFGVSIDYLLGYTENIHSIETKGVPIPILGYVRAGIPIEAIEEILDYEEISRDMAQTGDYFCLRIKGDSMEPRICEGDVVVVKKQPDIESGELAVVLINGQDATVKKVIKKDTSIILVPFNKSYEPMLYNYDEIMSLPVEIIGKVVELRGKSFK